MSPLPLTLCTTGAPVVTAGCCVHSGTRLASRQALAVWNIAMIMCGNRANNALTAHDQGAQWRGRHRPVPQRGREGPEVLMVSSMILRHRQVASRPHYI
jgi:hypothetical protein